MTGHQHDRPAPEGGGVLARLSNEMVRAQKQYFGKGPTQAKSYVVDDLLFVVMRGGLTTGEHTMVGFHQEDLVREFRQRFDNEMTERLTGMVEEITGRTVVNFQSQIMFDPDIVVEMFVFADTASPDGRMMAGEATPEDDDGGAASAAVAVEPPSGAGRR